MKPPRYVKLTPARAAELEALKNRSAENQAHSDSLWAAYVKIRTDAADTARELIIPRAALKGAK